MRGCLQRAKRDKQGLPPGHHTWNIILSLGRDLDGRYKQKWIRFHGTRQQAEVKLASLIGELHRGEFIEPSSMTVAQYLQEWLDIAIKPPRRSQNTYDLYSGTVRLHLGPSIGHVPLQKLSVLHLERYYADSKLSPSTQAVHHAIIVTALKAAVQKGLLRTNVACLAANRPRRTSGDDVLSNVWTAAEARGFLEHVKSVGSAQEAALFALALDSGARRGELRALRWQDLNGTLLRIERQLLGGGQPKQAFSPPKRGGVRSIELSPETVALLQTHKRLQAESKMAHRDTYVDQGLIFTQRPDCGKPITQTAVNVWLASLARGAKVRRITPHGMRHTCATLLLAAGVPPHVVQRRLGHRKVEMTLNLYAHVLPSMQQDAAARLAALLH